MALLASSLIDGFAKSNFMGQGIVLVQLAGSVLISLPFLPGLPHNRLSDLRGCFSYL
mgnify:CR=1 FL=1